MVERSDLGTGVYGSRLAAKLSGVTLRQLRYWVGKGILEPSVYRAGRGGRDLFSYTDLVQARAVGRLRDQRASLRRIELAINFLRAALPKDEAWHTKTLVMDGGILSLIGPGEVLNATHQSPGQRVFTVFLQDVTRDLLRVGDELSIGRQLEVDRGVQGGSPVIKGTRIPTRLIGELLSEGVNPARIRRMYPGVTAAGITAAKEFERQLAAVQWLVLLFDECIPREVVDAIALLDVPSRSIRGMGRYRTPDLDLPAVVKAAEAIFVTYDLDFTTPVILAEMAKAGVCVVMIRRPKRADLATTAEIILKYMRTWDAMCGTEPTIISCGLKGCRPRLVSTLPHVRGAR